MPRNVGLKNNAAWIISKYMLTARSIDYNSFLTSQYKYMIFPQISTNYSKIYSKTI